MKATGKWCISRFDGRLSDNPYLHKYEWVYGVYKQVEYKRFWLFGGLVQKWELVEVRLSMQCAEITLDRLTSPIPEIKPTEILLEVVV